MTTATKTRKTSKSSNGKADGAQAPASLPAVALAAAAVAALASPEPKPDEQTGRATAVLATVEAKTLPPAPVAPAQEGEQSKPETEAEKKEREEKTAKATEEMNKLGSRIGQRFRDKDASDRQWMVSMGSDCADYLTRATALGIPAKLSMQNLTTVVLIASGENRASEITRCLQAHYASQHFGAKRFAKLPINGQKAFASCLEASEANRTVYEIKSAIRHEAGALLSVCIGETALPAHLVPLYGEQRTKDKVLYGSVIYGLVTALKDGKNPLVPPTTKDEKTQAPAGAQQEATAKDASAADTGDEEETEEITADGKPSATNKRPEASGGFALDVKPELAAADMVKGLTTHDNPNAVLYAVGRAKEIKSEMLEFLISGMADNGRIEELRRLAAVIGRELQIANWLAANPGKQRVEALTIYQREGKLTSKSAA